MSAPKNYAPDPATLPPVSSIDVKAAYRARVGPISRMLLALFSTIPLTFCCVIMTLAFTSAELRWTVLLLGIFGDILRWRLAPDKNLGIEHWVRLFCDGQWSEAAKRAYAPWYCGLEKWLLTGGVVYFIILCILEAALPAGVFETYLNIFTPLHDWTQDNLRVAAKHSADLISHGYGHRVQVLLHIEAIALILFFLMIFSIALGGAGYVVKYNAGRSQKMAERSTRRVYRKLFKWKITSGIAVMSLAASFLLFFVFGVGLSFLSAVIAWDDCRLRSFCPHESTSSAAKRFVFFGMGSAIWLAAPIWFRNNAMAWSVRLTQEGMRENAAAN